MGLVYVLSNLPLKSSIHVGKHDVNMIYMDSNFQTHPSIYSQEN